MNQPIYGQLYRLTGDSKTSCIANGNTWAESKVDEFDLALNQWLKRAQAIVNKSYFDNGFTFGVSKLSIDPKGQKYVRIVRTDSSNSNSVHCFIEKETGIVLKAAGWKASAKGTRGNIYQIGKEGVSEYGALYLR